jgi:hypothetical protein
MKRVVLVLLILLPLVVVAQEKDPSFVGNQPSVAGSRPHGPSQSSRQDVVSVDPDTAVLSSAQNPSARPQRAKPAQSPKAEEPRPTIPGSMVGYIDNAVVGSEVRIRFDASFHDHFPDRAEFFYAQCGCNPNSPPGPPALVTNVNFQQLRFYGEYAPINRFSVFAEVPVRWIQPQVKLGTFTNQAGISDVQAGFKLALLASPDHYLTLQFQSYFPSGDASKGMGTNHYSIEPALLYYQRLSERIAVEAQIGGWHPIGGSSGTVSATGVFERFAGDVFFYGIGPSYELYRSQNVRFAPVIELVGWSVLGGLETRPVPANPPAIIEEADGIKIVNLKIGARTMFGAHSSLYVGYGRALTFADWYRDLVRVEYRYSF